MGAVRNMKHLASEKVKVRKDVLQKLHLLFKNRPYLHHKEKQLFLLSYLYEMMHVN